MGLMVNPTTGELDAVGDGGTPVPGPWYFGNPLTEGTWRVIQVGDDLMSQRLEGGVWVDKGGFTP